MDRAFDVILDAVHQHEGTINQFLGDGVMALFGAPIAHEDHAQRALSAALDDPEALAPLPGGRPADPRRRVPHADGDQHRPRWWWVPSAGTSGWTTRRIGDTVNLAARLVGIAMPGQIVVSRRTQRAAERSFAFEDLGEFQVKGKSEPVARLRRSPARSTGGRGTRCPRSAGLTPLVGRDRALGRLARRLSAARWTGRARIVAARRRRRRRQVAPALRVPGRGLDAGAT